MVITEMTNAAQPARSSDVRVDQLHMDQLHMDQLHMDQLHRDQHWMDDRVSVLACFTAARRITAPRLAIRTRGEVCFAQAYRTAGVHRSVAEGPPV